MLGNQRLLKVAWLCFVLAGILLAAPAVKAQSSREKSAASYLARGIEWQARGEFDRATPPHITTVVTYFPTPANKRRRWPITIALWNSTPASLAHTTIGLPSGPISATTGLPSPIMIALSNEPLRGSVFIAG